MLDPQAHSERVADNRANSWAILDRLDIAYSTNNGGIHLVVRHGGKVVDFWPGTGKFVIRGSEQQHRGVFTLLKQIGIPKHEVEVAAGWSRR